MDLPSEATSREDLFAEVKEIVDEFRPNNDRENAVYVLECNKPDSKREAINIAKSQLQEYSNGEDTKYTNPTKRIQLRSKPNSFEEALSETNENNRYISYPSWVEYPFKVDEIYYVGWSNRVAGRIVDHIVGEGAFFTKVFQPDRVEDIRWYDSPEEAKKAESNVGMEYTDTDGNSPTDWFRDEKPDVEEFIRKLNGKKDNPKSYAYWF